MVWVFLPNVDESNSVRSNCTIRVVAYFYAVYPSIEVILAEAVPLAAVCFLVYPDCG